LVFYVHLTLHRFGVAERVWLLDISASALRLAMAFYRHLGTQPYAVQAEIHNLPFRDRAFSLTLSGSLYEHFVGAEQETLVAENCRVSEHVLCQVSESTAAYWAYRRVYSLLKGGWSFGFEVPLAWERLEALFTRPSMRMAGRDWHSLAAAARILAGERWAWARRQPAPGRLGYLLRHDAVIAVEREAKKKPKG
jgi:hypothetical protein